MPAKIPQLENFHAVPAGCFMVPVTDDRHDPVLFEGENAIVDPSQRYPEDGELFCCAFSRRVTITQLYLSPRGWYMGPVNRPGDAATARDWVRTGRKLYMSDGPTADPQAAFNIIGRVIGRLMTRTPLVALEPLAISDVRAA